MIGRIGSIGLGFANYGMYTPTMQKASAASGIGEISVNSAESSGTSRKVEKTECQTCKNRKYVDGSNENVSFKSPTKMSPDKAAAGVRAHEQEHVVNAMGKASKMDGKVLQASVNLKTAICPECGRSYIAGGTTTTRIAYNKDNPYSKNQQSMQKEAATGNNIDQAV